ncbi:hypothetical protein [Jiangella alba]|uniref:Uncharacterized protein n=1 Tax=Jiangella alba TaxID=561176 RepID=A0A1H5K274_9ACTN|nr:hypothetical protein [Jiangella alba]SEE58903.1 hypothetical protein SAMN04488561_1860 [Jiangella alba]
MCLGGLHELPGGGAAWLEGAARSGPAEGVGAAVDGVGAGVDGVGAGVDGVDGAGVGAAGGSGAGVGGAGVGGAGVVVALARTRPGRPPRFTAAQARELAATLTTLADELDPLST